MRTRLRSRLPVFEARTVDRDLWKSQPGIFAGELSAAALQPEFRAASPELVRAGASGRRFRRDVRGMAGLAGGEMARALSRLEGAGETRIPGHAHGGSAQHCSRGEGRQAGLGCQPLETNAGKLLRRQTETLRGGFS